MAATEPVGYRSDRVAAGLGDPLEAGGVTPDPGTDGPAGDAVHHEDVLRFVEQFALVLRESGMPPMPARVFAYAIADDAERYSAGDLATGLRVSPAAISGAVRYLVSAGLLGREREPGTRSDLYTLYDEDLWPRIYSGRMAALDAYRTVLQRGVRTLGEDHPGGRRLRETDDFFAFLQREFPRLLERWRTDRAGGGPRGAPGAAGTATATGDATGRDDVSG